MSIIFDYEHQRNINRTDFDLVYYLFHEQLIEAAQIPRFLHYELVTHEDARFVTLASGNGRSVALVYLTDECSEQEALEKLSQVAA